MQHLSKLGPVFCSPFIKYNLQYWACGIALSSPCLALQRELLWQVTWLGSLANNKLGGHTLKMHLHLHMSSLPGFFYFFVRSVAGCCLPAAGTRSQWSTEHICKTSCVFYTGEVINELRSVVVHRGPLVITLTLQHSILSGFSRWLVIRIIV